MIRIRTQQGHYYDIHPNGNIERRDMQFTPSGQWRALGVHEIGPFGRLYGREDLDVLLTRPVTFKNGKPRFYLHDLDHGTHRIWGDGITDAWRIDR